LDSVKADKNTGELRQVLKQKIDTIGEPLIRNSLLELWVEKFNLPTYEKLLMNYSSQNR